MEMGIVWSTGTTLQQQQVAPILQIFILFTHFLWLTKLMGPGRAVYITVFNVCYSICI